MTKGLRKGLTSYGDAGCSLFLRKAFIKAMGYSDDALERPIIGVTDTFSDYNACHGNVPDLIDLQRRLAALKQSPRQREIPKHGYAKLFEDCVLQADQGCDFDFLLREGRATTPKRDE